MRLTFRSKLVAIVAVNGFALLVLIVTSTFIERRVDRQLASIQRDHVPRIGLQPELARSFDRIGRSFQDAAASADPDLLADARQHAQTMVAQIDAARGILPPGDAGALRAAVEDYAAAAAGVSRQLIDGETGEAMIAAIEAMQVKQARTAELIDDVTGVDERELARAFASAAEAQRTGARIRLIVSLVCLASILGLSIWIGNDLLRRFVALAAGFRRFGNGEFATPIPVVSRDELGDVARQANQMASRLDVLGRERDRSDWLKTGHAGLVEQLHGEMEPHEVADRAVAFLARHLRAPVAAIYYVDPAGELAMLGRYGVEALPGDPGPSVRPGQGLVGQAALRSEITVVDTAADGEVRLRTGVIDGHPRALVYVPLLHLGEVHGVLELVLLRSWSEEGAELMLAVREVLTIAIEVARARAATRLLLAKTQAQAAELLEARSRLEQKASELARASAYKSQFLANMSHELRTPLNAIIGFSELMHDDMAGFDAEQYKEFLGHIRTSGRHLLQLINDVLDLSKVEAGKLEFHPEALGLSQVVREVLGILRSTAASRRLRIESRVDPAVEELTLDPGRLKQVLYNYVSNALKFTPEGGRVEIRATPEGADSVRIEVEDTGLGIAADDLPRLFTDFQQVGADHTKTAGTGLGLSLTRRLVEAQGGTVGVRSVVGEGSVFHAILPRVAGGAATRATPPVEPTRAGVATVLVIEDDPRDQARLAEALRGAGYAVEVVSSGGQALARARERSFDAITLDLLLPDMSGLDVLRRMRDEGLNQAIPVIVVTVVAERGAVAGFAVHDVLPKPVDAEVVLDALLRAGVSSSAAPTVLVVDDDPAALRLMSAHLHELGYLTRCERDGQAALDALADAAPTAIVLDLLMPGMTGFEFLDHLRSTPGGRTVPVIVWTSKDLSADEHAMLRASADAIVSKGHGGSAGVLAELAAHLGPHLSAAR